MSVRSSLPPSSSAGGGGENLYSLKWNHYQSYLTKGLAQLLNEEYSMTDVTLACEGQFIQAHKVALAVCSPFFKEYFKTYRMEKSGGLIVLANVKFKDLKNLIQFIYHGEVNVRNADLSSFLRTANDLKIEGLADATKPDEGDNSLTRPNPNELKVQPSTSSASDPPSAHRLPSTSSSQSTSNSGGGPPLKRSRLSAPPGHRTGSPISVQNQNLNLSSASSSLAASSSESTAAVPIVDHSQSTTDAVQLPHQDEYDPLGMEDEQEEEMISFDEVKSEPIAVYSLNDEEDNSLSHHGGDALSGSMGNESSGMMYQDFNTSMSQQSAPGPSTASFQAHHRMQPGPSGPKPPAKPSGIPVAWTIGDKQAMMMDNYGNALAKRSCGRVKRHAVWKYFENISGTKDNRCLVPGGCKRSLVKGRAYHLMVHLETHHKQEYLEIAALEKERKERDAMLTGSILSNSQISSQCSLQNVMADEDDDLFAL